MGKSYTLTAALRNRVGKGSSRALRKNKQIPAVIYGNKEEPLAIAISYKEIFYKIHAGGFLTTIANISLDGKEIQVLPKAYQLDPVRDFPVHVDFLRISANSMVNINLPVHFINEDNCPGIKRGGVLNIVHHEIECSVLAKAIPEAITVDLSGYEIGSSIHLSQIKLPDGVEVLSQEEDLTVATISAPSGTTSEGEAESNV
ncbi:50S ribosomal protein L25/general stress protein Ctc [Bartonella sp. TP]|uniref:50S ribosomal protein L25/general stress protein Ctc n=1 Tax=Bartonella sp. TP TaxID=3057550 RepID=UPI0025B04346|nr:50S ribosomal protein L25/general stress protein Ctc [Bartonella sp. TP]MDN5249514.1 50S ribosomal protein L25/general stress protein Ctc [Alphaproteobacteria bacterium]WJW79720.1 50S ribosomal protein L25/general stress protein Ctc [Bartonella sp. TP]